MYVHDYIYRPISFSFFFTVDSARLFDAYQGRYAMHITIILGNTFNSKKGLVFYCTTQTENCTKISSSPTHFMVWVFTEPGERNMKRIKMQ